MDLASDVEHKILLIPSTRIKGTVVDSATGQAIPRFTLRLGAVVASRGSADLAALRR